ncbi:MAG: helix-turn-helix domain-containing protein [Dehalococcoidia bacterium]
MAEYRDWNRGSVKNLRRHLKMTQQELARELGTRQQTVSEWERGMYTPRGTSARLLSIIAERAGFEYRAEPPESEEGSGAR